MRTLLVPWRWLLAALPSRRRRPVRQSGAPRNLDSRTRIEGILSPGLSLKRWFLLLFLGITSTGLGISLLLRMLQIPIEFSRLINNLPGAAISDGLQGLLMLLLGLTGVGVAVWQMNRHIASVLLNREQNLESLEFVDELVVRHRRRQRRTGPKVVVIGGGTGMPSLLRGLRAYTDNITAVVTVADDGGSSGRLRQQMGVLPPGDFRNNIAALSDAESLMTQLLQYRFGDNDGLSNHNFGNIFITTMAAITGSFEAGIAMSSRVLAVQGRILPSTLDHVTLCAEVSGSEVEDGAASDMRGSWRLVRGESRIPEAKGHIMRVFLEPESCRAYPETVRAILSADLILAAPGSFFTSLMPNLLVPYVRKAITASRALRLYVCNVATQPGETEGYTVDDHMVQLRRHAGDAFTAVLANDRYDESNPPPGGVEWVTLPPKGQSLDYALYSSDLIDEELPWRHDPEKLGSQIMRIYQQWKESKAG